MRCQGSSMCPAGAGSSRGLLYMHANPTLFCSALLQKGPTNPAPAVVAAARLWILSLIPSTGPAAFSGLTMDKHFQLLLLLLYHCLPVDLVADPQHGVRFFEYVHDHVLCCLGLPMLIDIEMHVGTRIVQLSYCCLVVVVKADDAVDDLRKSANRQHRHTIAPSPAIVTQLHPAQQTPQDEEIKHQRQGASAWMLPY